jgi:hypothetical protein
MNTLTALTVTELLTTHSAAIEELRRRGVVRSQNNPTGDYTEWLVSKHLNLTLETNATKGFDAKDCSGNRYQIKGRRITTKNKSTQLGVIRDICGGNFDFLIAVVFDEDWNILIAAKLPHSAVSGIATFRKHVNGHIMHLRSTIFSDSSVEDLTLPLRNSLNL